MKTGIYIHIPFCKRKCYYCDFLSFDYDKDVEKMYFKKIFSEIEYFTKVHRTMNIDSIFLGGGTPSLVDNEYYFKLFDLLHKKFKITDDCEITIEGNPESLTLNNLKAYRTIGINRLSIGVQSFDDTILKVLGRIHSADDIYLAYSNARIANFENINLDFMMNIPGESEDMIEKNLSNIKVLDPEHISYYSLILEENTPLKLIVDGGFMKLPDEKEDRLRYHHIVDKLNSFGLYQYEISNFSKPNFKSRHNLKYWNFKDYLGFGIGAVTKLMNIRYKNSSNLTNYIFSKPDILSKDNIIEIMDKKDILNEIVIMNLRLNTGIDIDDIDKKFNIDFKSHYKNEINKALYNGWINYDEKSIKLTPLGQDLCNQVELIFYR
ncbi:MAG: radical SAM family heme chaperone HemW [Tissierellia bacterium]|nr:radical SAM family heme chaperone HemW [Tissierellia bacterium]